MNLYSKLENCPNQLLSNAETIKKTAKSFIFSSKLDYSLKKKNGDNVYKVVQCATNMPQQYFKFEQPSILTQKYISG